MKSRFARYDFAALSSFLVFAVLVFQHLWRHPQQTTLADNDQDQVFFEWVLTHAAQVFTHGVSPFFADHLNAPLGVNLMANTSVLALALPLSPITLLFGAGVTLLVIGTLALGGTAAAWYFFLSRDVVQSRVAGYIGALFCGFAPAMISQDTGHPNIAAQFLLPFIIRAVFHLGLQTPLWRRILWLAIPVTLQFFINEEVLFLTAFALLIFIVLAVPIRDLVPTIRRSWLPACAATLVCLVIVGFPLWYQYFGPQVYHGLPGFVRGYSSDLGSFTEFSHRSILVGDLDRISKIGGPSEENTFYGWPLLILLVVLMIALARQRVARAVSLTILVFALFSLGSTIRYQGQDTKYHGPWYLLDKLPLFDSVVPTRVALVLTPLVGVLLAMSAAKFILRQTPAEAVPARWAGWRWVWAAGFAAALLPLLPTPQPSAQRRADPQFFASGNWRRYIEVNSTVVVIPGGWWDELDAMRWSTATNQQFKIDGGYFLVPDRTRADRQATFGPNYSSTLRLLGRVSNDGVVPVVTTAQIERAKKDLAHYQAKTVLLPEQHNNSDAIRQTADLLFGPGQHVDDMWIWQF